MILQALKEYYDRKAADPGSDIAPEGFEKKEIPFLVVITLDGEFVNLEDTREQIGKKLVGKTFLVPRSEVRTGNRAYEKPFLLWDHIGYLLGYCKTDSPQEVRKVANQHRAWLNSLENLPEGLKSDEGVVAIARFYATGGPQKVRATAKWTECMQLPSCNMTFRLAGDLLPVPCRPRVHTVVHTRASVRLDRQGEATEAEGRLFGRCLVTGQYAEIARTHGRTPINKDTKSLVALQRNSGYDSYGKTQGLNAPVCKSAEFAYTTALNTLLKSRRQRLQVGDATTVFWAEKDDQPSTQFEEFFSGVFDDDPDRGTAAVVSLYRSIQTGVFSLESTGRFYVLGLSPNAARIAVRFWISDTVAGMAEKIRTHFEDLQIVHQAREREFLSLRSLLVSTAVQGKDENVQPHLAGDFMRSILGGLPYPQTLFNAAVSRIKAEQARKDKRTGRPLANVTRERAALLKACLNRTSRFRHLQGEEVAMSLDMTNTNIGYRLGRLFATLERIQQESSPGINATIRDKFYGAASSTPITVFGNLTRLKNHHLAKLDYPGRVFFERLIGEIMSGIADFPPHLKLEDQGRFAIGYYHQMQDFFTKKSQ